MADNGRDEKSKIVLISHVSGAPFDNFNHDSF